MFVYYSDNSKLPDEIILSIEDDLGLTDIDNGDDVDEAIANFIDATLPVSADDWVWAQNEDDCSEIIVFDIKWNKEGE